MSFLMMIPNLIVDFLNFNLQKLFQDQQLLVLLDVFMFRRFNKLRQMLQFSRKFNLKLILLNNWLNVLYFLGPIDNCSPLSIKCLLTVLRLLVYIILVFRDSLLILFLITMLIEVKLSVVFLIRLIGFILFLLIVISILLPVVLLQQLLCLLDFIIILLF